MPVILEKDPPQWPHPNLLLLQRPCFQRRSHSLTRGLRLQHIFFARCNSTHKRWKGSNSSHALVESPESPEMVGPLPPPLWLRGNWCISPCRAHQLPEKSWQFLQKYFAFLWVRVDSGWGLWPHFGEPPLVSPSHAPCPWWDVGGVAVAA